MRRSDSVRKLVLERDQHRCRICGKGKRDDCVVEPHHVKPLGFGGRRLRDTVENQIALCRFCHNKIHSGEWKVQNHSPLIVTDKSNHGIYITSP